MAYSEKEKTAMGKTATVRRKEMTAWGKENQELEDIPYRGKQTCSEYMYLI